MNRIILLIPLSLLLPALSFAKDYGSYHGAIYISNNDGNTITFRLPNLHPVNGEKISIRIIGIDTPGIKGKCEKEKYNGQQAKEMVDDILNEAEQIDLKNMESGKDFWLVEDVIVDGEKLSDILVESGLAVRYDGQKKTHNWCQ